MSDELNELLEIKKNDNKPNKAYAVESQITKPRPKIQLQQTEASVTNRNYKEDNTQNQPANNQQSVTQPSQLTPKKIITLIGMFLLIASAFSPWKTDYVYSGFLGVGNYNASVIRGFDTWAGLISAGVGILGIIFVFANKEKTAHMYCSIGAIIAVMLAFIYLGTANGASDYNPVWQKYNFYSKAGMGIYMTIFGAAITLGGFLVKSPDE